MRTSERGVLFLCTGNSARSLIAESLLRDIGSRRFRAYSAGSHPTGRPHPMALATLRRNGHHTDTLRSKSWNEFKAPGGPDLDWVFTLCDSAREASCPVLTGAPAHRHWGLADPAAAPERMQARAFEETYRALRQRVLAFVAVPWETLQGPDRRRALDALVPARPI